eukprot:SM000048S16508  [mRNA]  locus=s48:154125:156378:+ [translate_table: standard]
MEAAAAGGSKAPPPAPPPTPPPGSSVVPSGFSLQRRQAGAATEALLAGAGKELWLVQLPEAKQLDLASLSGVKLAVADGAPDGFLGSIRLPSGARYSLQSEPCSNADELFAVVPRGDEVAASVRRIARRVTLVQALEPPAQPAAVVAPADSGRTASSGGHADVGTSVKKSRKEEKDKRRRHAEQPPVPVPAPVLLNRGGSGAGQTAAGLAGTELEVNEKIRSKEKKEKKKEKEKQEEKRGEEKVLQPLARPTSVPAAPASGKVGERMRATSMQSTEPTIVQGDVKEEKDEKRKKKKKKEEGKEEEVKQAEGKPTQRVPAPAHRKDAGAAEKEVVELVHTATQAPRKEKKRAKRDAELLTAPVPAVSAAAGAGAENGARHELANSSAGLEDAAHAEGRRKKRKKAEEQLLQSGLAATAANEKAQEAGEGVGVHDGTKLPAEGAAKHARQKVRRGGEEGGARTTSLDSAAREGSR